MRAATVLRVGDHAAWLPVKERASKPIEVDRHGQQRHRDALSAGEEHVELARRGNRGDLVGELEQLVGGVAHGADRDHDVVTGTTGVDDALGDRA